MDFDVLEKIEIFVAYDEKIEINDFQQVEESKKKILFKKSVKFKI